MTAPLPPEVVEGWREMVARIIDPKLGLGGQTARDAYKAADAILSALPLEGGGNGPANASPSAALHGANLDAEPSAAEALRAIAASPHASAPWVVELATETLARLQALGPSAAVWRPEVAMFADMMEAKLRENDHKGGWKDELPNLDLLPRLREETDELRAAIDIWIAQKDWGDAALHMESATANVGREAADVANFAMMIADVCGALPGAPK